MSEYNDGTGKWHSETMALYAKKDSREIFQGRIGEHMFRQNLGRASKLAQPERYQPKLFLPTPKHQLF